MWTYFALGALVFSAIEEAVDKIAMVEDKSIHFTAATFWRNFLFLLWLVAFALFGIFESFRILFAWPIAGMAVLFVGSSFFYTYLLRRIEITSGAIVSYLSPFLYLLIDLVLLKLGLSFAQIAGILLLITGGILFVLNPKTRKLKKEFTPQVFWIFFFNFILSACQYYAFKYYLERYALSEASYYVSIWLFMMPMYLAVIAFQNCWKQVARAFRSPRYMTKITFSKGCDAVGSYLWLHAIALASVSQVNALGAVYPLILLGMVYVLQNIFRFKAEERFSRGHLVFKLGAIVLLCLGGFLAR